MGEDSNSSVWISTLPLLESNCDLIQTSWESHTSSLWVPVNRVWLREQCHCGTGLIPVKQQISWLSSPGYDYFCATLQERVSPVSLPQCPPWHTRHRRSAVKEGKWTFNYVCGNLWNLTNDVIHQDLLSWRYKILLKSRPKWKKA